jgi:hypothetical protein
MQRLLQLGNAHLVGALVECFNPAVRQIPFNHHVVDINRLVGTFGINWLQVFIM